MQILMALCVGPQKLYLYVFPPVSVEAPLWLAVDVDADSNTTSVQAPKQGTHPPIFAATSQIFHAQLIPQESSIPPPSR